MLPPGLGRDSPALLCQFTVREVFLRRAGGEMHTHLGTGHHIGISHIIAGVSHIYQLYALYPPQMLPDGQQIRQHLCGMEFIGQAVPYRNPCILCQLFHNILPETAVFDSFVHSSQHPCCIGNAFLLPDLGA